MPRGVTPAAIALGLLLLAVMATSSGSGARAGNGPSSVPPEIQADFDADGVVEVIVAVENDDILNALRNRLRERGNGEAQREAAGQFRGRINNVVNALPDGASSLESYDQFGAFSLTVRSQRLLDFLASHPLVNGLEPVRVVELEVASSLPFINQGGVAATGLTGAGTSVAVIDTGINFSHAFFGSCTSPGFPATCRVPVAMEFGDADGNLEDDHGHGTNVAGIAGSVAPETSLLSLDVFTFSPITGQWTASTPDILEGLNWVIANAAAYNTKAVNLSLGGNPISSSPCDLANNPATVSVLATLRTNGVLPVIASGNDANKNAVSWPACVTGAYAVGAVYDGAYGPVSWNACGSEISAADTVTCFSNSHETLLDSLAPGTFIDVAGTNNFSGTSMAAPHIAGAAAVLSTIPTSLAQIEGTLTSTGPQVTDTNDVTKRRLDLCEAAGTFITPAPEFSTQPPLTVFAGSHYLYQAVVCGFSLPVSLALVNGPPGLALSPSGMVSWSPTGDQVGPHEVTIEAATSAGTTELTWTIEVAPVHLYFTLQAAQTLSGVTMQNEDIVFFDGTNFSLFFDGSAEGLGSFVIDAFDVVDDQTVLLSFTAAVSIGGDSFDDSDIVQFDFVAETFSMYLDGSDVSLSTNAEDVDAFSLLENGDLLVSTTGSFGVTALSGSSQDIIRFTPSSLGSTTAGTWSMYWDGSDVFLTTAGENIDGTGAGDTALYLSTTGDFAVTDVSGSDEDVFICNTPVTGSNTLCNSWNPDLFFDGSLFGLGTNDLIAIDVGDTLTPPVINSTPTTTATVGAEYTYQAAASGTSPITWALLDSPPVGMTIDPNIGLLSWTPEAADVGPHDVTIEATNSVDSDTQPFTITVSLPPAPEITSTAPTTSAAGATYSYQPTASGGLPITWSLTTSPDGMTVDPDTGVVSWTPEGDDVGDHPVTLEASNLGGSDNESWTLSVAAAPPIQFLFSVATQTTLSGTSFENEDVVAFDGVNFSVFFDGSDVGVGSMAIDAIEIVDEDEVLLSFTDPGSIPDVGTVDDSDVVKFTGTFGVTTSGTFDMFLDGSTLGLDTDTEDVDAIQIADGGSTVVSTTGVFSLTGSSGSGEDLVRLKPDNTWKLYWDGSDVGLSGTAENLDGASFNDEQLFLSTTGAFAVDGASGNPEDVFVCVAPKTGGISICDSWAVYFDGSSFGLGSLVSLTFPVPSSGAIAPDITSDPSTSATVSSEYTYQATASGSSPITWSLTSGPTGLSIDPNTGLVTWTPDADDVALSPHDVTIEATNSVDSDSQTWQITVTPPAPPEITSTPSTVAAVDQLYAYQATATGAQPITWSLTSFPDGMTVDANTGLVSWTPDSADVGDHSVILEAHNIGGSSAPQGWTVSVSEDPAPGPAQFYFSLDSAQTLSDTAMEDEDIVAFDGSNFSLFFDGSDVGLDSLAIDAIEIVDDDEILLSFRDPETIPDVGAVDDSDVVKFSGTLGSATSGSFAMHLDGSAFGLDTDTEDVDAVHLLDNGKIVVSTTGTFSVPGASGAGEDLIRLDPDNTWKLWWDGSDVGLSGSAENIDGSSFSGGKLYLSTSGNFAVTGISGGPDDVFVCDDPKPGGISVCNVWSASLLFDGGAVGVSGNIVAIELP